MNTRSTLDYLAAKVARNIVERAWEEGAKKKDIENLITRALGVLQAQGVYALYLFLYSQAENANPATWVLIYLWNALRDETVPLPLPQSARIHRLRENPKILFCDPPAVWREWQRIQNARKKAEKREKEVQQRKQECERQIEANRSFWSLSDNEEIKLDHLEPARDIILKGIRELTTNLDTLLLVRDLYEQTLIYARYHAKALGGEEK